MRLNRNGNLRKKAILATIVCLYWSFSDSLGGDWIGYFAGCF